MESQRVKELKDDAVVDIQINKTFYQMCKASLYVIFKELFVNSSDPDAFVKEILTKQYIDMTDKERIFYSLTLLIGEVEKQAETNDLFIEKEISVEELKEALSKAVEAEKSNEG
tara:strand:- start:60 stop:401 length:342 start_codon:yes stop_codon:yes gene_type:complete